jgi:hypothetical protein
MTAKVVVQQSKRTDVNLFDMKSAILANYAQLVAMAPMFNKATAARSLFGVPYLTRISKCTAVTNGFLAEWE